MAQLIARSRRLDCSCAQVPVASDADEVIE